VEEKPWYKSKGVIGGIVAVLAAIGSAFKLNIDAGAQAQVTEIVLTVIGAVGGAIGVYGRVKATSKIKGKKE